MEKRFASYHAEVEQKTAKLIKKSFAAMKKQFKRKRRDEVSHVAKRLATITVDSDSDSDSDSSHSSN